MTLTFTGVHRNRLIGDRIGSGPLVVLLHGGGQTRQSWTRTARRLAAAGRSAVCFDLRGHGDSDWSRDGRYDLRANVEDLRAVLATFDETPALIGASLGGLIALTALGDADHGGVDSASCLVLVDVAPTMELAGLARVRRFMQAAPDGFADLDEAAAAVAAYLPGRSRPPSASGLARNLQLRADGRYHWRWDPRILDDLPDRDGARQAWSTAAAARIRVPTLLVRGAHSDVVGDDGVRELQRLIPHAVVTEVGTAGHMIVGSDNDDFGASLLSFVAENGGRQRARHMTSQGVTENS